MGTQRKLEKYRVRDGTSWLGKEDKDYELEDYLDTVRDYILWLEERVKKLEEGTS